LKNGKENKEKGRVGRREGRRTKGKVERS